MKITWLGHSAFRVDLRDSHILIDPFLTGNAKFTGSLDEVAAGVTHIVLTHGHDDHIGDAPEIAQKTGAQIVANFEICMYLSGKGAENINPGNTGGVIPCGEFSVALTPALHSASTMIDGQPVYLGNPNGVVLLPQFGPHVYHAGDTAIFSDMDLIRELYRPGNRPDPGRRPLHHGRQDGGAGGKTLFRFPPRHSDALRHFPDHRPDARRFCRRHGGLARQSPCAANRRGHPVLKSAGALSIEIAALGRRSSAAAQPAQSDEQNLGNEFTAPRQIVRQGNQAVDGQGGKAMRLSP